MAQYIKVFAAKPDAPWWNLCGGRREAPLTILLLIPFILSDLSVAHM